MSDIPEDCPATRALMEDLEDADPWEVRGVLPAIDELVGKLAEARAEVERLNRFIAITIIAAGGRVRVPESLFVRLDNYEVTEWEDIGRAETVYAARELPKKHPAPPAEEAHP